MIVKLIPLLLITLKTSRCSLVIDNMYQKGLYLSDYCPNMKYCREGSHVMCMFYDPNTVKSPRCNNAVNVSITADLANDLMDITNTIRSKIANGKETGKNGVLLPRGYGIFRLKWDNELATFAQLLANQCILRHDLCRATKRFPNPSQTVGVVRFFFPDWKPMSPVKEMTSEKPGLTSAKIVYAITVALKGWYSGKSAVTEHMVKVVPDWTASSNQQGKVYLDIIHGPATHMGCGISAYSDYKYYNSVKKDIYNCLQVICNFSAEARKGTYAYETEPPIPGQGFSSKCGCPPGSEEDSDCLCNEVKTPPRTGPESTCPVSEPAGNNCDPTLVLLPIFTMEDAPPEKLYEMAEEIKDPLKNFILQRIDNTSDTFERQGSFKHERARTSTELFDFLHAKEGENVLWQRARIPSSSPSAAPSYNTIDNTSDTFERQGSFKHGGTATSAELFDFLHAKERENVLWQRTRSPTSPQSPAPSYNTEKQTAPEFLLFPDPKPPPPPPPPPPRKSPALRTSPAARPPPRPRPPPPPPPPHPPPRIPPPLPPVIHEYTTTQKNHEKPRPAASAAVRLQDKRHRPLPKPPPIHHRKAKKGSLFTRVAQFQLPKRRSVPASLKVIKKDVAPRKDFSNLGKVVQDYLRSRPGYKILNENHEQMNPKEESKPPIEEKSQTEAVVIDTGLHNAEETVISFNQYLSQKNNSNFNDKDVDIKDDNDNKLLALLDTLEREVKHIALDGSEKELFDARIRKIYGSIVGKAALLQFPKPIVLSTPDTDAPEIDFGDTKVSEKLEPDHEEDIIVTEEPKQRSRFKIHQRIGRVKNYNPSMQGHKWKNKFIDSFDQKKYKDNVDVFSYGVKKPPSGGSYDHKYKENFDQEYGDIDHKHKENFGHEYADIDHKHKENFGHEYADIDHKHKENFGHEYADIDHKHKENFGHEYADIDHKHKENVDHQHGDIDHKHMDELDRKYNEDINKKYSENHLEHEYKFSDNFHHQHNYDLDRKYEENDPASRSKIKYEADRAVFREFEHNSLDTQEDNTPENYRYKDIKVKHDTPDIPLITKDREKKKRTERKHRKRVKSLNAQIMPKHTNDHNDPLSLERRKYYQDKLDNIRKKLRSRKNGINNDSRNERSQRRMHTKIREDSRSRSKSPADNFYMPERARFLHGF